MIKAILFFIVLINVIGFTVIGIDKNRAVKRKWRIREKDFFYITILGGGIGVYTGMRFYRHKTKHRLFMWGIPAIMILQICIFYFAYINW